MRLLHLYRPLLPSTRAQAIQVLRTCHALAEHGYEVTLIANRGSGVDTCFDRMGISAHPNLQVLVSPLSHPGLTGLWFRRQLARWWLGPPGLVLARDKRRLLAAVQAHGKRSHRIILETHGLESLIKPEAVDALSVERQCIAIADGIVANCGGTLAAWKNAHAVNRSTLVSHNGTHVREGLTSHREDFCLVLGSMRTNKGVNGLLSAAAKLPYELRWVGGTDAERARFGLPEHVKLLPPVDHANIEELIAKARVLIAPLGDNIFSQQLTSPLKLWDYLATTQPIVTADTPCTAEIAALSNSQFHLYQPDDDASITHTITAAWDAPDRRPFRRTWAMRAEELIALFETICHA